MIDLVGELVINQAMLSQRISEAGLARASAAMTALDELENLTRNLQDSVMAIRAQPVKSVFQRMPRLVRETAALVNKHVRLVTEGENTEVDKTVIERLSEPLTHMIRNSIDHGIETPEERIAKGKPPTGTLSLRAFHEAGAVNIEVLDDGAGINPERVRAKAVEKHLITPEYAASLSASESINLIFLPGFSMAAQVTSISGRGVGMDVVKTNIEKISGSVHIVCPPTGGTCLRIKIPLTLAIIPGLIVACDNAEEGGTRNDERFVIPQSHLVEMTRVDLSGTNRNVDKVNGALIFRHRGNLLPLVYLASLLHKRDSPLEQDFINNLAWWSIASATRRKSWSSRWVSS